MALGSRFRMRKEPGHDWAGHRGPLSTIGIHSDFGPSLQITGEIGLEVFVGPPHALDYLPPNLYPQRERWPGHCNPQP